MFLQNIDNPVKVRNQLKRMHKQNAQYCYTWDFETRQVYGLDKSEYVASLYEVQINGLVKRCECWVKQRFIVQKQVQQQSDRRNSLSEGKNERSNRSPKKTAANAQQHSNNSSSNNNSNNHHHNSNGQSQINSPIVPQHDKFVIRFESYGHSKRERMTQSINPLSYAFDKILVDYVYLFIETEEVSKQKLIKEINKSINNARYYDASRKLSMLEDVFNEKNTPLAIGFQNTINQKKRDQESLYNTLISNIQVPRPKSSSNSSSSSGRNLRSQDGQKKQAQQQQQQQNQNQQNKQPLKETLSDNKMNGKQPTKEKGTNIQNQNSNSQQQLLQSEQKIQAVSINSQNNHQNQQQQQQQSYQPPSNSIASQTRTRSPHLSASTPTPTQSPNKPFSLQNNNSNNNSPSKQNINHGSPKKVSAFNASPSKSNIAASCSDNIQAPQKTILNTIITRSNAPSPKKIAPPQSPQKIIQSSPRMTPSPSPKSQNISKQQNQSQQQQQSQNFKAPSNEISTRSHTTHQNNSSSKEMISDSSNQKKKTTGNENEKPTITPQSPTLTSQHMQTRHQEQLLSLSINQGNNSQINNSQNQSGKTSAKASDIQNNKTENSNKTEMEIEESSAKQSSKEKQSPKRKALK